MDNRQKRNETQERGASADPEAVTTPVPTSEGEGDDDDRSAGTSSSSSIGCCSSPDGVKVGSSGEQDSDAMEVKSDVKGLPESAVFLQEKKTPQPIKRGLAPNHTGKTRTIRNFFDIPLLTTEDLMKPDRKRNLGILHNEDRTHGIEHAVSRTSKKHRKSSSAEDLPSSHGNFNIGKVTSEEHRPERICSDTPPPPTELASVTFSDPPEDSTPSSQHGIGSVQRSITSPMELASLKLIDSSEGEDDEDKSST